MKIIGYSYEADMHCVACSIRRFGVSPDASTRLPITVDLDGNSIPYAATDNEGNVVGPVFCAGEQDCDLLCGDCGKPVQ